MHRGFPNTFTSLQEMQLTKGANADKIKSLRISNWVIAWIRVTWGIPGSVCDNLTEPMSTQSFFAAFLLYVELVTRKHALEIVNAQKLMGPLNAAARSEGKLSILRTFPMCPELSSVANIPIYSTSSVQERFEWITEWLSKCFLIIDIVYQTLNFVFGGLKGLVQLLCLCTN